ncbi:cilia- and flagella-associated protein 300 [Eucyclogobius newberryi]|uniref:cilia- and flagella-associated protein 300 n=1 Tax=Eucyclogobius newberryi TaxID=166745 RepID=UPI003B59978A
MAGCEFEKTFTFRSLPSKKFTFLQNRETLSLLMKWSMLGRLSALTFSFDQSFFPYNSEGFALCFFTDSNVMSSLKKAESRAWGPLEKPIESVKVEMVPCSKVSMDLFDPIYSCGILRPSGHIVKCFHDVHPDYDELRQMLLDEESEHYSGIGREERQEFLFRLFKHLCLGGELCQNEETIEPYISTTKQIYKDLISVQKDPETKKISVVSTVLKVTAFDESEPFFPGRREDEQNFAYLIVDPLKKHVTLIYHIYGIGDFSF